MVRIYWNRATELRLISAGIRESGQGREGYKFCIKYRRFISSFFALCFIFLFFSFGIFFSSGNDTTR